MYKKGTYPSNAPVLSPKVQALSGVDVPLPGWQQDTIDVALDTSLPQATDAPLYMGKRAVIAGAGPCGRLHCLKASARQLCGSAASKASSAAKTLTAPPVKHALRIMQLVKTQGSLLLSFSPAAGCVLLTLSVMAIMQQSSGLSLSQG